MESVRGKMLKIKKKEIHVVVYPGWDLLSSLVNSINFKQNTTVREIKDATKILYISTRCLCLLIYIFIFTYIVKYYGKVGKNCFYSTFSRCDFKVFELVVDALCRATDGRQIKICTFLFLFC